MHEMGARSFLQAVIENNRSGHQDLFSPKTDIRQENADGKVPEEQTFLEGVARLGRPRGKNGWGGKSGWGSGETAWARQSD